MAHGASPLLPPLLQAGPPQPGSASLILGHQRDSGGKGEFNGMSPKTGKPQPDLQFLLCSAAGVFHVLLAAQHRGGAEGGVGWPPSCAGSVQPAPGAGEGRHGR